MLIVLFSGNINFWENSISEKFFSITKKDWAKWCKVSNKKITTHQWRIKDKLVNYIVTAILWIF